MWIDTHCHPFASSFTGEVDAVFDRAQAAGVGAFLVVGFGTTSNKEALALAAQREDVWASLGVHPCDCGDWTPQMEAFIRSEVAVNPKVVALGEMGLDYHHMRSSKEVQAEVFRAQIRLAKELNLPCIVHSRDAAEDTLQILIEEEAPKAIFHCYSYDADFAKKVWERGYITSFSGVLTYPSAKGIQEAARLAPADLLWIETDCPYLAPQSIRGQRNEMARVAEIGEFLANLRGISPEQLRVQLRENWVRVLGLET